MLLDLILLLINSPFSHSHGVDTGELVAIKKLYMKSRDPISLALLRELVCLMSCQHENVVRFIEVLITTSKYQQQKFSLVTELCEMDLYSMLKTR
jgi:hypothetical protein